MRFFNWKWLYGPLHYQVSSHAGKFFFFCLKLFIICFDDGIGPTRVVKTHVGCSDETSIINSANSVTKIENLHLLLLEN